MRDIRTIFLALSLAIISVSCDAFRIVSNNEVSSQGSPYELIVVSNQPQWEGALGDTLRTIFRADVPYLQQSEPIFDVLRVTELGYDNLVLRHRNILRTIVNPNATKTSASVQYNLHATPQIVITVQGGSDSTVTNYIGQNRDKLVEVLEAAERDRAVAYGKKFGVKSLEALISDKFGFEMSIPEGYSLRNELDDFVWISYEYPTASQGFFIYKYPAVGGTRALSVEQLTAARNRYAAKIPGPVDGSYMTTVEEYTPDTKSYSIDGRVWVELRGLWNVANDFMGGPFVSYSTLVGDDVVTIDMYVYSPKLGKRNFIKGLEHLIYNVKIP
ncbi:MAG: DUF4837 family protein [Rikenellaceae bacterium]